MKRLTWAIVALLALAIVTGPGVSAQSSIGPSGPVNTTIAPGVGRVTVAIPADRVNTLESYLTLVPAKPGVSFVVINFAVYKEAGTAYTVTGQIAIGHASTLDVGINMAGLLDQTAATGKFRGDANLGSAGEDIIARRGTPMVVGVTTSISGGTGTVYVEVVYSEFTI